MTILRKQENKEGASWARKGWIIWQYTSGTADLLLSNECIKSKVFNDFLSKYPKAKEGWNIISGITSIKGGYDDLDFSSIIQISNGYNALMISWNIYKTSVSLTDLLLKDVEAIKEIDAFFCSINSQIEN